MRWNILEISQNHRYLKLFRGFAVIMEQDTEIARVTLDELCCVLLAAQDVTISKQIMVRLAELGVPVVFCGSNFVPVSIALPLSGHHLTAHVQASQLSASKPLRKRLWQKIVKSKIENQAAVLAVQEAYNKAIVRSLIRLSTKVRSGDLENCEAQAARIYWPKMMGAAFRRRQKGNDNINNALNYGYAVMRAACARAIVAAGLNPAFGLHHNNMRNPLCLVDDVMEIYRPIVDLYVISLPQEAVLNPSNKATLAGLLQLDAEVSNKTTTVAKSMQYLAVSLVKAVESGVADLVIPKIIN